MQSLLDFALASFAALFPVVDPIGAVPIFLVLTAGVPKRTRDRYAKRIALYVVVLLIVALLVGGSFLRFFGVSLEVVRIAGGIVVFHAAWHAMNSDPKLSEADNQAANQRLATHTDIAFMPMTVPLLAGPGSIAVALGLAAQAGQGFALNTLRNLGATVLAVLLIGLIIWVALRSSTLLLKVLGASGIQVMSRLLGLFVMAIGVQLILNGFADWLRSLNLTT